MLPSGRELQFTSKNSILSPVDIFGKTLKISISVEHWMTKRINKYIVI